MFGFASDQEMAALARQVRTQRWIIEELCRRVGIDPSTIDPMSQLDTTEQALVREGKKIAAIKHHRERTGSSLVEAKNAVDQALLG